MKWGHLEPFSQTCCSQYKSYLKLPACGLAARKVKHGGQVYETYQTLMKDTGFGDMEPL